MVDIENELYTMIGLQRWFVPRNLTYEALLVILYEIICVDLNSCVYVLRYLLNTNDKIVRFKIKNDREI